MSVLKPLIIRGKDDYGFGSFGASRGSYKHQGIDYVTKYEQYFYAPEDGKFIREKIPYANKNTSYNTGLLFVTDSGYEYTVFYVSPYQILNNERFKKGQIIGLCENIAKDYSKNMTNHAHIEIRKDGKLLNPSEIIGKKTSGYIGIFYQ